LISVCLTGVIREIRLDASVEFTDAD
jgi:hypothetical protein